MRKLSNGMQAPDPLSLNVYTYCYNNPIIFVDENGHWVQIAIGALVGGVIGAGTNFITQAIQSGWDLIQIDVGHVIIAGASGGALTSIGVGGPLVGAFMGGTQDLATQIYDNQINNHQGIDWVQTGVATASGAAFGVVGDKISGIIGIPDVPVKQLNSMGNALTKRIGNAVIYQIDKGATQEISKALKYYYSQSATSIYRTIIRTLLIEGVRDAAIDEIIDATGLEDYAKDQIHNEIEYWS